MNPYETPPTFVSEWNSRDVGRRLVGPGLIAALLLLGALVGFLSLVLPPVRTITMPRFGWIGLVLCLNPLIFLAVWLRVPTRSSLIGAAIMTFFLGVINAIQLLFVGTVSQVTNEFNDRLHSSWLWSVLPFVLAGIYLYWIALRRNAHPKVLVSSDPSNEPMVRVR